jgi:hypothetical protein
MYRKDGSIVQLPLEKEFIAGSYQTYKYMKQEPPVEPEQPVQKSNNNMFIIIFIALICLFIILLFLRL